MASRLQSFIINPIAGKLEMTIAPALVPMGSYVLADNIEYDAAGSKRKRLGTNRAHATAITGSTLAAVSEFWRYGTALTGIQKFVACSGTQLVKDDGDGVWDVIQSGWGTTSADCNLTIAQGFIVAANDRVDDAPLKWDQTTVTTLATTSHPKFTACVYHLRRLWTMGERSSPTGGAANPSRTNYCAAGDITDWVGADAGSLIFDEDDGDRIMGISQPFFNRLYVFKGPNRGSVHEVSGTTVSTFARNKIITGAPCVSHKSIITTPNDVYWVSMFGIHSLQTTQRYGDTTETFLSRPIQSVFNALNRARLNQTIGFYAPHRNLVGWAVPNGSDTTNTTVLTYNYVRADWSVWTFTGLAVASAMLAKHPTTLAPTLYLGGYTGYLYTAEYATKSDEDGTKAYLCRFRTPLHSRFSDSAHELTEKQIHSVVSFVRPSGGAAAQLLVSVDGRAQSASLDLLAGGGADLIGSTFIIGSSVIGQGSAAVYIETPIEDRGRGIQLQWAIAGTAEDMELFGYAIRYAVAETAAGERS